MAAEPPVQPDQQQARLEVAELPAAPRRSDVIGPPENLNPAMIYKLYRGTVGEIDNYKHRIWAEWPSLQLCWARSDQPAQQSARVSLDDLSVVECKVIRRGDEELVRVDVFRNPANNRAAVPDGADQTPANGERQLQVANSTASLGNRGGGGSTSRPAVRIVGSPMMLVEFAEALQKLLQSRESDGRKGLEFVQRRLFQYLWTHQGNRRQARELFEAQAVLAFNLEPRDGVAYLRTKLENIRTDDQVGEWLAKMSAQTGGLDPTMLGAYFSRRDTGEVFKAFVRQLDFSNMDIDEAVRKLFDTFKPGGEGQVITRILELFAEAYYLQWRNSSAANGGENGRKNGRTSKVAYKDSDGVFQVAVSLIMLNTGLHVATKKVGKRVPGAAMTVEEYITNVRRLVSDQDVPDEALKSFYEHVKAREISVEPLPRVAFAQLPVQPDIEGWLVVLLEPGVQRRYWAVLALRRMYLFSDASEMEPGDAIDLKDTKVKSVSDDGDSKARFLNDVETGTNCCVPMLPMFCGRNSRNADILDADARRAFELAQNNTVITPSLLGKLAIARGHLFLVAETPELMEKWVSLIEGGPYS